MAVNEIEVDVDFQSNILHVDVAGDAVFTYADKVKLNDLTPITNIQIDALFS